MAQAEIIPGQTVRYCNAPVPAFPVGLQAPWTRRKHRCTPAS